MSEIRPSRRSVSSTFDSMNLLPFQLPFHLSDQREITRGCVREILVDRGLEREGEDGGWGWGV